MEPEGRGIRHTRCGGRHPSVAEVRQCESASATITYPPNRVPADAYQIERIAELMEHPAIPDTACQVIRDYINRERLSKTGAANTIKRLLVLIKEDVEKAGKQSDRVTEEGIYKEPSGIVWRVVQAKHGTGHLYASFLHVIIEPKRAPDGKIVEPALLTWYYKPGALRKLSNKWRLTAEQAKEFGDLYGCCIRCHVALTKPESIERGTGDTCAGKI